MFAKRQFLGLRERNVRGERTGKIGPGLVARAGRARGLPPGDVDGLEVLSHLGDLDGVEPGRTGGHGSARESGEAEI